jgi:hypothetical protein
VLRVDGPTAETVLRNPSHIVNWLSFGMTANTVSASFGLGSQ